MFKRLRNKFLVLLVGTMTLLVLVFFGALALITYTNMELESDDALRRAMGNFVFTQDSPPEIRQGERRSEGERNAAPFPSGQSARDIPQNERSRFSPPRRAGRDAPVVSIILNSEGGIENATGMSLDEELYAQLISAADGRTRGKIRLEGMWFKFAAVSQRLAFVDITRETDILFNMLITFLWIAFPLLAAIFLLGLFFANRAISPIETAFARQKEFIADASHELKTPLAAISANADALGDCINADGRKWLAYIKEEITRMSGLTEGLLYLAKMDAAKKDADALSVDFSSLLRSALMPLEAVLFEKGISVDVKIDDGILVSGNAEQLRRAVGVLLDNAVKYSGTSIAVKLDKLPNFARLCVSNDGAQIDKSEIDKIFDRFYRADKAREYTGGFGLGLSIARAVVERHGGKITCENAEGVTRFTLRIPL